ncbi:aspartyl-phosphate phosphatase Spo0E family protein [Paenibacillus oryzisoli]|uniref:Uncharacterized protein n=1 Tax=Paenibacillus oryzisoli TaxID=1850517 RepID=A0A198APY3_9BACL|nr:aspartyl-phosphate phosphatase Spo0E family protein [Paenibacillus oryzisoli]OAS23609.1 hypothetical protein A8708_31705 [Paenibacillus oryzisoli]
MDIECVDDESMILKLIEQARYCLLKEYRNHSSFSHPKVYLRSTELDKLLEIYYRMNKDSPYNRMRK